MKRGRKSAAELGAVVPIGEPGRLRPRDGVPDDVREIWRELVAKVPADHFRPADEPLLEAYCQAIALGRRAYAALEANGPVVDGRPSAWLVVLEKAHRSAVALSARLRLSPQHRLDPRTVSRNQATASAYEMMELDDDGA
jgi:phage terminase small subunit